jgi:hypothetical protein
MADPNESSTSLFVAATVPFFILMIIFYSARIYSRVRPIIHLYWDDLAITLAVVSIVPPKSCAYISNLRSDNGNNSVLFGPKSVYLNRWTPYRVHNLAKSRRRTQTRICHISLGYIFQFVGQNVYCFNASSH